MTAERPWMKFYPQDWRADERLRNCSLAARGLWLELIALMHRSERYGHLLINGKVPTSRALAIQAGAAIEEVESALAELEAEGVFSRDDQGVIFSRRMLRDEEKHRRAANFGKRGVRAKAKKDKEEKPPLEGSHEGSLEDTHEPPLQLRGQRPESPPVSPKVKGSPKGKHPLPDEWDPAEFSEGSQCRSIVDGWSRLEFERQLEKFKAHHGAAGTKFADWQRAWATWILNSVEFANRERRATRAGTSDQSRNFVDTVLEEAEARSKKGGR
jgi:DNA-binding transcriptional regulator YhcF (GntR family)